MNLSLIVACDKNGAIGYKNQLLCHLKDDLRFFKQKTENQIVIMGRKTFESIGKPLPNRLNIVLSSIVTQQNNDNLIFVSSLQEAINISQKHINKKVFIIGGESLYKQIIHDVSEMYITHIDFAFYDADAYFPLEMIDLNRWEKTCIFHQIQNEENDYPFYIYHYIKRRDINV
ncbi:MAG: dihydrofolate reductase [Ignavibacterium sp.]|nr:dihydrofolate reductase [Ignavibacterium sp.]